MGKTVSFVAREELAEWLESRADEEMKTVSSLVQDIVAAEYRRQNQAEGGKSGQKGPDKGGFTPDALESDTRFDFPTKREADAVRTQFDEHLSQEDDGRMKYVIFAEGTPGEIVEELERREADDA